MFYRGGLGSLGFPIGIDGVFSNINYFMILYLFFADSSAYTIPH